MNKKQRFWLLGLLFGGIALFIILLLLNKDAALLNPKGEIASKERSLIITSTLLMLIVVVPVYVMTFAIAWKYRAGNKKAKYSPDWDGHRLIESSWWAIPGVIILILAVVTWKSSHDLDPFKALSSTKRPLTIQVIALQWKWLFIYPQQNVASVNMAQIPTQTPIDFEITSDAPMNSFWIPQLGGQIYAMPGMMTHLHLVAAQAGDFRGSSANISGQGFAGMDFTTRASSAGDFGRWADSLRQTDRQLSADEYQRLAQPSENQSPIFYSAVENSLFQQTIAKYISPTGTVSTSHQHGGDL